MQLDVAELAHVRGVGDAKAVKLKAAPELGRRLAALSPEERSRERLKLRGPASLGHERWRLTGTGTGAQPGTRSLVVTSSVPPQACSRPVLQPPSLPMA